MELVSGSLTNLFLSQEDRSWNEQIYLLIEELEQTKFFTRLPAFSHHKLVRLSTPLSQAFRAAFEAKFKERPPITEGEFVLQKTSETFLYFIFRTKNISQFVKETVKSFLENSQKEEIPSSFEDSNIIPLVEKALLFSPSFQTVFNFLYDFPNELCRSVLENSEKTPGLRQMINIVFSQENCSDKDLLTRQFLENILPHLDLRNMEERTLQDVIRYAAFSAVRLLILTTGRTFLSFNLKKYFNHFFAIKPENDSFADENDQCDPEDRRQVFFSFDHLRAQLEKQGQLPSEEKREDASIFLIQNQTMIDILQDKMQKDIFAEPQILGRFHALIMQEQELLSEEEKERLFCKIEEGKIIISQKKLAVFIMSKLPLFLKNEG